MPASSRSPRVRPSDGGLVDLEADAVSRAVPEALAVAGRLDHGARRRVDVVAAVSAGAHGGEAGELRLEDDVVDAAQLCAELPGGEGARDVAAVPVDAGAGVDDHELPAAMTRSPGTACAWAPWSPAATMAAKASPSAPRR